MLAFILTDPHHRLIADITFCYLEICMAWNKMKRCTFIKNNLESMLLKIINKRLPSALNQAWRQINASTLLLVNRFLYSLITLPLVENADSDAIVDAGAANRSLAIPESTGYLAECILHHCRMSKSFCRGKRSSCKYTSSSFFIALFFFVS